MLDFNAGSENSWPTDDERADISGATALEGRGPPCIVRGLGSNAVRWSTGERLHHLFEEQCDRFAEQGGIHHPAIEFAEHVVSYGELDRRATQLARYLRRQGLGSGDVIGLLFDKSISCYVSLLAVLKIHAAYVPLDPAFPAERIGYIVTDSGLSSILTLSSYQERLCDLAPSVICLDAARSAIERERGERLDLNEAGAPVSDLCYIIYTSGSTGRPKGVPIEHASICNFVRVAAEAYGYCSDDRVYQGLTIAFDFSVEEIWVPLIAGATLIPNWTGSSLVGEEFWSFLAKTKVSALCCVPTLLATIEDDLPDVRLLIVGGEACPPGLVKRWHSPSRTILNTYGPTETTVTATMATLRPDEPVTIGAPLPTYSVVILAPGEKRALPRGEIGEIGIAGVGLSKGYLGRDDLTKAAFIEDFLDLPDNPSRHIYRSGDLGFINALGQIEYLGRIDTQVKVRGYRIELAEIESVIMQLPQVAQAVVSTFTPEPEAPELVAYYTLKEGCELAPEDIARELRSLLPSYMVPPFYECLPLIPMLPSGKVDRKALPPPGGRRQQMSNREYVAPETPLEHDIARLLAGVLKVERISVEDHFFDDLGANSLLMAQLSARIRRELKISDLSMRDIYLYPSIRQLSAHLQTQSRCREPLRRDRPSHVASNFDYYACGLLQMLLLIGVAYFYVKVAFEAYEWALQATSWSIAYQRAIVCSAGLFALMVALPIAAKWLLIGRWKEEEFPVWSLRYFRFWAVKTLIRWNPILAFIGTPIYNGYLRALGADVSWNAVIFAGRVPVCTDLITIGDGAVIRRHCVFSGYRAESNRIKTGRITLGRDTFVSDGTVLDIDTVMEDGSQLGHSSAVHAGQRLTKGRRYHGVPAEETTTNFERLERKAPGLIRKLVYSLGMVASQILLFAPIPLLVLYYFVGANGENQNESPSELFEPTARTWSVAPELLLYTTYTFIGALLLGLAVNLIVPRVLSRFITPGREYPLYGVHYYLYQWIHGVSNSTFYNTVFGDSSLIVHYLRALGYRSPRWIQTGSNFGVEQRHDVPSLCVFGTGAMVSDGIYMLNADFSTATFRLSETNVGAWGFFGNDVFYPTGARVGDNCLLGTMTMVPIDGPVHENTGLLGSPCFTIPRSVRRDQRFDAYKEPAVLKERLRRKNASNAVTLLLFLAWNWFLLSMAALIAYFVLHDLGMLSPLGLTVSLIATLVMMFFCGIVVERATLRFKTLRPEFCSIYDEYFWLIERHWKLSVQQLFAMFNGTPLKTFLLRRLGVRVGKKVFDDGSQFTEPTLVAIGDYCTLNAESTVQSHSLEDGTFKSDHIIIGSGCTIGVKSLVHYGVAMAPDTALAPCSFLMKGERPSANSLWSGNPAKEVQMEEVEPERPQAVGEKPRLAPLAATRERRPMLEPVAARSA